ncbi:MAG: YlmC/YmxH family sporulation protein [Clostridiales bacterium]|nr:YlmC/YmxH family sporulation protein [Clostridiales bacterium]
MFRVSELRNKDVINSVDGKRLGFIRDIELDLRDGRIRSLILPGESKIWRLFGRAEEIIIEWPQIRKIGADVILVELPIFTNIQNNNRDTYNYFLPEKLPKNKHFDD